MTAVLLIIHLLVAAALTGVILLQRSEGGALGMSGGGPGGMITGRSAANLLTRSTMILGAIFMANSVLLAIIAGVDSDNRSVFDRTGEALIDGPALPFGSEIISGDDAPSDDGPGDDAPSSDDSPNQDR